MVPYNLKVMNVEDDMINLPPIRQNRNAYPRGENNFGDDSSMVILDERNLCDTVIAENEYLVSNDITESRDSVLSYIHIGGAKCRI